MNNIGDALLRMVRIARETKKASDILDQIDFGNELLRNIYGDVLDSIFYLVGDEDKGTFESSITYRCINSEHMPDECCVQMLLDLYKKNVCMDNCPRICEQPKPNTISPEEMRKMTKVNGGYMTPEGDWK